MAYERHTITVGDTLTPLACQLKQRDADGSLCDVQLTGLVVKFSMVAADGSVKVAETTEGVVVIDQDHGEVRYDFHSSHVDTEGTFYGWFHVYDGLERDTYPAGGRKLQIDIIAAE